MNRIWALGHFHRSQVSSESRFHRVYIRPGNSVTWSTSKIHSGGGGQPTFAFEGNRSNRQSHNTYLRPYTHIRNWVYIHPGNSEKSCILKKPDCSRKSTQVVAGGVGQWIHLRVLGNRSNRQSHIYLRSPILTSKVFNLTALLEISLIVSRSRIVSQIPHCPTINSAWLTCLTQGQSFSQRGWYRCLLWERITKRCYI